MNKTVLAAAVAAIIAAPAMAESPATQPVAKQDNSVETLSTQTAPGGGLFGGGGVFGGGALGGLGVGGAIGLGTVITVSLLTFTESQATSETTQRR